VQLLAQKSKQPLAIAWHALYVQSGDPDDALTYLTKGLRKEGGNAWKKYGVQPFRPKDDEALRELAGIESNNDQNKKNKKNKKSKKSKSKKSATTEEERCLSLRRWLDERWPTADDQQRLAKRRKFLGVEPAGAS
jgi:hypothetical protein